MLLPLLWCRDEDRLARLVRVNGRLKCGVIVDTQIIAKPDEIHKHLFILSFVINKGFLNYVMVSLFNKKRGKLLDPLNADQSMMVFQIYRSLSSFG